MSPLAQLEHRIYDAFGGHIENLPSKVTNSNTPEQVEITELLTDLPWNEIPDSFFTSQHESLVFLTPEAFHYYLPAYLLAALKRFREKRDSSVKDTVIECLRPRAAGTVDAERFIRRWSVLSKKERLVVILFFEFVQREWPGLTETTRYELGEAASGLRTCV